MSFPSTQDMHLIGVLFVTSLVLHGCSFGTSQDRADCDGGACDCKNNYYGMEAGMYIGGVPIEHASLRLTIPRVEPDTVNSTGCCSALYDLYPVREEGVNVPGAASKQQFCNTCAKAPNTELADAAKSCPPSLASFRSAPRASAQLAGSDEGMNGADAYSDCGIDFDDQTIPLINGKSVTGVKTSFNIKWTDLKNSSSKPCCTALWPLIRSLYLSAGETTPTDRHHFCNACKTAYNPGVGLTAFRFCASASSEHGESEPTMRVSPIVQQPSVVA